MAAGETLLTFPAICNEPKATINARLLRRNDHWYLGFTDGSQEHARFSNIMPRKYGATGIKVRLHWMMATAIVGNVDWMVAFERLTDQDLDVDGFGGNQTAVECVVHGTCGKMVVTDINFSHAQIESIVGGEAFRMRVIRDGASDTAVGDAQLVFVELQETPP